MVKEDSRMKESGRKQDSEEKNRRTRAAALSKEVL